MEELSNMLNRLLHRGDEEEIRQDELKKQIDAIYRIYAGRSQEREQCRT